MKTLLISILVLLISLGSSSQEDTLFLSQPGVFTNHVGTVDLYSISSLSPSKFIIAFEKGGTWDGRLKVGEIINDTTVIYGDEFIFDSQMSFYNIEIDALTSDEFLITYNDFNNLKIRKGKIDGNNITLFSPYTYLSSNCSAYSVSVNSESSFIISYKDPQNEYGKSAIGIINENQISIDQTFEFTSSSIHSYATMDTDTLSNSKFVITWGYSGGYAVIGNINANNEITFGELYEYQSYYDDAYHPKVRSLNENKFVIAYIDDYSSRIGKLLSGIVVDENQISYGNKVDCSPSNTANISITTLDDSKIIVAYHLYNEDDESFVRSANIIGSEIQVNSEILNDNLAGANFLCAQDSTSFVVIYYKTDSFNGISKLGQLFNLSPVNIENYPVSDILLFPNPATSYVTIKLNKVYRKLEIQLINSYGQIIYECIEYNYSEIYIDISQLKKGNYLLKVITNGMLITRKVLLL